MTDHPDLDALRAGLLDDDAAAAARAHVAACPTCQQESAWASAERRLFDGRRRSERGELDALWAGIERQVGGTAQAARGPRRAYLVAGALGAALAAAALLLAWPRGPASDGGRAVLAARDLTPVPAAAPAPVDAGPAAVAPADGPADAAQAVADAERAFDRALDLLEQDYLARRPNLSAEVAGRLDESFLAARTELRATRAHAGADLPARVLGLDVYAHHVRGLRGALGQLR